MSDLALSSHFNHDCSDEAHHLIVSTCIDHQDLTFIVQRMTNDPPCCNCLTKRLNNKQVTTVDQTANDISSLVLANTDLITSGSAPAIVFLSATPKQSTSSVTDHSKGKTEYSDYPAATGEMTALVTQELDAIKQTDGQSVAEPTKKPQQSSPPTLNGLVTETESSLYISGTDPATHNKTAVPDSESSFPTDSISFAHH